MSGNQPGQGGRSQVGERSERTSFRIALAIALMPIPTALLIAWALGDPPWRPRRDHQDGHATPATQDGRKSMTGHEAP